MNISEHRYRSFFPEGHMALLYSDEKEILDIVVAYIKVNLEKNFRCIYITGNSDTNQIIDDLKLLIDYDSYIEKKQLFFIDKEELYSKGGSFAPNSMIEMFKDETNLAIETGFAGLAITGEYSWILKFDDGFEKIIEYEYKLNDLVFSNRYLSSIGQYNQNEYSENMIIDIIQMHPYVIWKNKIHMNPFYIPVEGHKLEDYKLNQIKKHQINSLLNNLREITNEKDDLKIDIIRKDLELIEGEEKYEYIFENSTVGISIVKPNGEMSVNQSFCKMLGYTKEELEEKKWSELTHPDDVDESNVFIRKLIEGEEDAVRCDKRYLKKDGSVIWANDNTSIRKDANGEPLYFLTSIIDITERKNLEDSILRMNKDLLESQRIAGLGTWRLNVETNQMVWSDELYNMYGFDPTSPPPPYAEYGKLFTTDSWNRLSTVLERTRTLGTPYELELETIVKDGTNGWMWVRGEAEKDIEGKIVAIWGATQDITVRKKQEAERSLLKAQVTDEQKLESIGVLASGVAHEINNPINGILNYGQIILDETDSDSDINKFAGEIIHETNRVSEIVKNLLEFSRHSGNEHSYAITADIIRKTLSLVNTIFKHDNISLNVVVDENISQVKCKSQQIQQVLMNLLTNARDSLNDKYPEYDENKKINLECHEFSKDDMNWISISVEDFGTGIPKDVRHRIFDPFFTTKDKEKGTGLGLSISYGIIKEHHGEIKVDSKEGEYTKFTLLLPCDNGLDINENKPLLNILQ